jgi:hypothetical protein
MTAPAEDEEKQRLESVKQQLDEERRKFTEATIRLGKERALLEVYIPIVSLPFTSLFHVTGRTDRIPRRKTLLEG